MAAIEREDSTAIASELAAPASSEAAPTAAFAGALAPDEAGGRDEAVAPREVERDAAAVTAGAGSASARPNDRDSWARPVSRLTTAAGQAPLDTVRGRRPVGAIQGFGKLWQKTYRVELGREASAQDVVAYWKEHFSELWPRGNSFYAPLTGIAPGEVALLQVGVLGGLRLSTGVVVIYVDDESFTFMTPEGHMFAGWITFSAAESAAGTLAQVTVLMRAQNPLSELGLMLGGHRQEDHFWQSTLASLAARFGVAGPAVETHVLCVDSRRQWRRAGNIRHDASFRSALFTVAAPVRWARRSIGRR